MSAAPGTPGTFLGSGTPNGAALLQLNPKIHARPPQKFGVRTNARATDPGPLYSWEIGAAGEEQIGSNDDAGSRYTDDLAVEQFYRA